MIQAVRTVRDGRVYLSLAMSRIVLGRVDIDEYDIPRFIPHARARA